MKYSLTEDRINLLRKRWTSMKVLRQQHEIDNEAHAIIAHRSLYEQAQTATADATHPGVPWYMIGVIDAREGGINNLGHRHLHNGDPLSNYTRQVPKGRPRVGHGPPFTWLESAVDALRLEKLTRMQTWPIERILHELEPYNGLGYFQMGRPSPYIWSCTNQYDPPYGPGGKYVADHKFDPHVVDQQVGCAPVLAKIFELVNIQVPTA